MFMRFTSNLFWVIQKTFISSTFTWNNHVKSKRLNNGKKLIPNTVARRNQWMTLILLKILTFVFFWLRENVFYLLYEYYAFEQMKIMNILAHFTIQTYDLTYLSSVECIKYKQCMYVHEHEKNTFYFISLWFRLK